MYAISLDIYPTSGLTFRRMPSSILHISTYPFLPPTTMSGWLRRLLLLSVGHYPETAVRDPDYFALPADYYVLGAYPVPDPRKSYQVHTTYRQGIRAFNHNAFSRLIRYSNTKEVYQLHTWEYLFVQRLRGYVVHKQAEALEQLQIVVNYGSKLGKEGFAYVGSVSEVKQLYQADVEATPDTLIGGMDLATRPGTLYAMYRYQFASLPDKFTDLRQPSPSSITGFIPTWAGWSAEEKVKLAYWTDGQIHLPVSLMESLYG